MRRAFGGGVRERHSTSIGSHMRFTCQRILLVIPALFVLACGDQPSAPDAASSELESPHFKVIPTYSSDKKSADIIVEPSGGVFTLGIHAIYFPANAICDPETSSYGPTEWDAPCDVLARPIQFHAEIREVDGRSYVDFTPAVRFVPTSDPASSVWLYMKTSALSSDPDSAMAALRRMSVMYSPAIGEIGINEALADPSLRTYVWVDGGIAFRKIKHFSGYNIFDGWRGGMSDVGESGDLLIEMDGLIMSVMY